jgi:hypothetical protein
MRPARATGDVSIVTPPCGASRYCALKALAGENYVILNRVGNRWIEAVKSTA